MRYRVCVLPDHPDVEGNTGNTNFMNKLGLFQDSKLKRFHDDNSLASIVSSYTGGDYTAAYNEMMGNKDIQNWVPAHGFPRNFQNNDCSADIIKQINDKTDAAYKDSAGTFCEYDASIGAFVDCSKQDYHSVQGYKSIYC